MNGGTKNTWTGCGEEMIRRGDNLGMNGRVTIARPEAAGATFCMDREGGSCQI
jgi:hypothetical protein